jgi:hypothetical protein
MLTSRLERTAARSKLRKRRFPGFDDKIVSIRAHLVGLYSRKRLIGRSDDVRADGTCIRADTLSALADLSGRWINAVHGRRPPKGVVLDVDSSVSPTQGEQENSVWSGHYACTCYHPAGVCRQVALE